MVRVNNRSSLTLLAMVLVVLPVFEARSDSRPCLMQMRVIVPDPRVCLGKTRRLEMEAVFSNSGDTPIAVYKSAIYEFTFTRTILNRHIGSIEEYGSRKDVGTGDPALREQPLPVQPHSAIVVPLEYDISNSYFQKPGSYSVLARYMKLVTNSTPQQAFVGSAESNEVLFEIIDCR
jgi:hypothetical protein